MFSSCSTSNTPQQAAHTFLGPFWTLISMLECHIVSQLHHFSTQPGLWQHALCFVPPFFAQRHFPNPPHVGLSISCRNKSHPALALKWCPGSPYYSLLSHTTRNTPVRISPHSTLVISLPLLCHLFWNTVFTILNLMLPCLTLPRNRVVEEEKGIKGREKMKWLFKRKMMRKIKSPV